MLTEGHSLNSCSFSRLKVTIIDSPRQKGPGQACSSSSSLYTRRGIERGIRLSESFSYHTQLVHGWAWTSRVLTLGPSFHTNPGTRMPVLGLFLLWTMHSSLQSPLIYRWTPSHPGSPLSPLLLTNSWPDDLVTLEQGRCSSLGRI